MLKGIEILNKIPIVETPIWFGFLVILLSFVALSFLCILLASIELRNLPLAIISAVLIIASMVFLVLSNEQVGSIDTGRYRYEVTIDDNVSFVDLQERYDVIEQHGKIWTIEYKEVGEE